jgi:NTE family protein
VTDDKRFTLVLSGGGLKGLAHVGVFRALEEHGMQPSLVVGSSMGSLIAAAWGAGLGVREMLKRALEARRKDVFRVAHADMALRRMNAPAVYRREPLEELIHSLVDDRTFDQLPRSLVINTVDIDSGMQVLWGTPGLTHIRVADAVFASCALPGLFPPREIDGHHYCDGALITNLPVRAALGLGQAPVIAVHVGATTTRGGTERAGFASNYVRGFEIVMRTMLQGATRHWHGHPVLLVEPRVEHISMFSFNDTREMIEEGYRATTEALEGYRERLFVDEPGIYPQKHVRISVDRDKCIGCTACVWRAPDVFRMTSDQKAEVITEHQVWSPFDGNYIHNCPTHAISARHEEHDSAQPLTS